MLQSWAEPIYNSRGINKDYYFFHRVFLRRPIFPSKHTLESNYIIQTFYWCALDYIIWNLPIYNLKSENLPHFNGFYCVLNFSLTYPKSKNPTLDDCWRSFAQKHHISSLFKHQTQGKVSLLRFIIVGFIFF